MSDVYKDKEFIALSLRFIPEYYDVYTREQRESIANRLEHYVAKIQNRKSLKLIVASSIHESGLFMPEENTVYISEETINDPFSLVFVLFHEGFHYKQFNLRKYKDSFSETEVKFYEYNAFMSKIDGTLPGYIYNYEDMKEYFLQPIEYFAYKEAHIRGVEFYTFMEKEYNEKGYVKKYNSISCYDPKTFKKSYYEKNIFPLHLVMMEKIKERVEEDSKQYGLIKERVDRVVNKIGKLNEFTPVELSHFFFPLCWQELDLASKTRVYNEFVTRNKLRYAEPIKAVLELSGLEVLDKILYNHTNFTLQSQTSKNIDFILDFKDFNPYYREQININKLYKKHKNKDINSFYSFKQLGDSFFLFPKFKTVKDEYLIKSLKIYSHLEEVFTPDYRKHMEVNDRIFDLTKQLEAIKRYEKKQEKFVDKFQKNRVI